MRAELASPGIGASVSVALNDVGPTSSKLSLIGVGYSTSKVSIRASHPHDLNCASTLSAFALLCAEPTWLGSAAMVFIQPPISAGTIDASNRRSRSTVADAFEAVCAPSELATRSAANVPEPVRIARRILPPCRRSDVEDTSAFAAGHHQRAVAVWPSTERGPHRGRLPRRHRGGRPGEGQS